MMSGVPLETCSAFNKRWNNKFYYKVASCWLFIPPHTAMHGSMNIKNTVNSVSIRGRICPKVIRFMDTRPQEVWPALL
jgi:hypothetical protein